MSDVKQVEIEVDVTITVPVKVKVDVDLDALRAGTELEAEDVSKAVAVAPIYATLSSTDFNDADIGMSATLLTDFDEFFDAVESALAEFGIDVGELQAEGDEDEDE